MNRINIVSPHLDDATLSCWNLIEQYDSRVITVFSGIPSSKTRTAWDLLSGQLDSARLMEERHAENELALAETGTEIVNLPHLDGQYIDLENRDLRKIVTDILGASSDGSEVYLPLALGSKLRKHPDHIAVHALAGLLRAEGKQVSFYADIPYALPLLRLGRFPQNLSEDRVNSVLGERFETIVHELTSEQQKRKRAAVQAYRSQYIPVNLLAAGALSRSATYRKEVTFCAR